VNVRATVKRIWASIALLSVEVIVLLVVFVGALVIFYLLVKNVIVYQRFKFDQEAFNFLSQFVGTKDTAVMNFFTFLGTHTFLIPANLLLIAYFLFVKRHNWYSIKVPVVSLTSLLLMQLLKLTFHRDRPLTPLLAEAKGYSFPSGHALMSMTFYGLIIYLIWENIESRLAKSFFTTCLILLILFIGVSRIYLRVHYASDVLAGYSVGLGWLLLSITVLNKVEGYTSRKVEPLLKT
jgi:membrane-associated phospholipid phosphatase